MKRVSAARILVAAVAVAASLLACGPDQPARRVAPGTSVSSSPAAADRPKVTPAPTARPVTLGRLPPEGLVVSDDRGTLLLDLDGTILEQLSKFRLGGNPGAAGVWLQRGSHYFRFDLHRGQLAPVGRSVARTKMYDEGPEPDLPPPHGARVHGRIAGHWRYAYRSGSRLLAQWSGECEVPTAFWVEDGTTRIVTGERRLARAPESVALGWTLSDDALVLLGSGACGSSGNPPGIYRFTAPGKGLLLFETRGHASAEMW